MPTGRCVVSHDFQCRRLPERLLVWMNLQRFSEGCFTRSMKKTSAGPFAIRVSAQTCSCIAVRRSSRVRTRRWALGTSLTIRKLVPSGVPGSLSLFNVRNQLPEGFSADSITTISCMVLEGSNLNPSCSCKAVNSVGALPSTAAGLLSAAQSSVKS